MSVKDNSSIKIYLDSDISSVSLFSLQKKILNIFIRLGRKSVQIIFDALEVWMTNIFNL